MVTAAVSVPDAAQQLVDLPATTIALSREVTQHAGSAWHALTSPAGTAVWLGRGAVLVGTGETYHCDDGSFGVVRSYHPIEQLRLSWHSRRSEAASLIEVDLTPLAGGTLIRVWHEGVDPAQLPGLRAQWQMRLSALAQLIDG